jgi:hypothetical protein
LRAEIPHLDVDSAMGRSGVATCGKRLHAGAFMIVGVVAGD